MHKLICILYNLKQAFLHMAKVSWENNDFNVSSFQMTMSSFTQFQITGRIKVQYPITQIMNVTIFPLNVCNCEAEIKL